MLWRILQVTWGSVELYLCLAGIHWYNLRVKNNSSTSAAWPLNHSFELKCTCEIFLKLSAPDYKKKKKPDAVSNQQFNSWILDTVEIIFLK